MLPAPDLHPLAPPHQSGLLAVGDGHHMWFEVSGLREGLTVLCVHGGPGSASSPQQRRFFDPTRYRIVQFDQRGCGQSRPQGALHANTTPHLVSDIEALRAHLGVSQWLLCGGSWGATLALAYAAAHPSACLGLLLRGTFLAQPTDLDWFLGAAAALRPVEWQSLVKMPHLSEAPGPHELLQAYAQALNGADAAWAQQATQQWMQWEAALEQAWRSPAPNSLDAAGVSASQVAKYRLQTHYLQQGCFLQEHPILSQVVTLAGLPGLILHGQMDVVCVPRNAWQLHQAWPGSTLQWIGEAGHSPFTPSMAAAMLRGAAHFADHGHFHAMPQQETP